MERAPLVDPDLLAANASTERYQAYWGASLDGRMLDTTRSSWMIDQGGPGVVSVITRGPTGTGAAYEAAEPVGSHWHRTRRAGAEPLVSRPTGA